MKKILLALALISTSQTMPFSIGIGGGPYGYGGYGGYYGGYYGGPYGYGYGPGYGYGGVAFVSRPKSDAEVAADKEVREARIAADERKREDREERRDKEQQRRDINKQIKYIDKDIKSARRDGDSKTVDMLEKQKADLRKELAKD